MIAANSATFSTTRVDPVVTEPTLWGLSPTELHDRYWTAAHICVVRQGSGHDLPKDVDAFLLLKAGELIACQSEGMAERMYWSRSQAISLRVARKVSSSRHVERCVFDEDDRLVGMQRGPSLGDEEQVSTRAILTRDAQLADLWSRGSATWASFRKRLKTLSRSSLEMTGQWCGTGDSEQRRSQVVESILDSWLRPGIAVPGVEQQGDRTWVDNESTLPRSCKCIGAVWIGAGRTIRAGTVIAGPAILWDSPDSGRVAGKIEATRSLPGERRASKTRPQNKTSFRLYQRMKRVFDVCFSIVALLMTLPLYPIIMVAIWIEDGFPAFFSQQRETLHHRIFRVIKFRSMYRNADELKARLQEQNEADGPQFYMDRDPRVTRVGSFLRKFHLDELPQFWNVLVGDMSVVGPRPSPRAENRFCPPWSEARLTVKAGITGLWQVKRTRAEGHDFQEWIRYDLEYISRASFWMDLKIIFLTLKLILMGSLKR